ncbi:MarR family transcriptional regulator [Nocardioides sp. NPDC023903]|uniref:MarR family transcriptional regulator n=1 Tax=Nocardioides sp. NPDC023903 TaxID=3157195 RepID=UPI0033DC11A7
MPRSDAHGFLARQPGAVDSAFAVLEAVDRIGPGVTARQLVEALPMSQASVYRIIKHLVANEYLVRTPDLRGFVIGERVRVLGTSLPRPGQATDVSLPAEA